MIACPIHTEAEMDIGSLLAPVVLATVSCTFTGTSTSWPEAFQVCKQTMGSTLSHQTAAMPVALHFVNRL